MIIMLLASIRRTAFPFLVIICWGVSGVFAQNLSPQKKDSLLNNWQTIPGTEIKIIPPAYFQPFTKDGKYGFKHDGAAASISVEVIKNTAYVMVIKVLTKEYIDSQGLKYISREDVKTKDGKDGTIIAVGFTIKSMDGKEEVDYERLMLFTGDYNKTVWIQGNYPVLAKKVLYLVIRESLLSVTF